MQCPIKLRLNSQTVNSCAQLASTTNLLAMAAANAMKATSTAMKAMKVMKQKVAMKAMKRNNNKSVNQASRRTAKTANTAMKAKPTSQSNRQFNAVMGVLKKFVGPLISEYYIIKAYNSRFKVKYPTSLSSSLDIIPALVFCGLLC